MLEQVVTGVVAIVGDELVIYGTRLVVRRLVVRRRRRMLKSQAPHT